VASFGAAVLSYYLVEQPFRNSHLEPVPLLLRYGAVSIAVLVACTVIWRTHGIPERFPALAQVEADLNKPEVELNKCTLPDDSGRWNLPLACYGPKNFGPSVAVWGDSHARVMAPGLRSISTAQGYGFILLTRHSCPPLTGASVYDPQRPLDETACSQFNRKALDLLKADQNVRIVILVSFWESPFRQRIYGQGSHRWSLTTESDKSHAIPTADASRKIFTQSLTATIRNLREAGKEVIVIEDAPDFDFDPVSRLASHTYSCPALPGGEAGG
jgi:hypothetical protein